jgi:hypothetical protein
MEQLATQMLWTFNHCIFCKNTQLDEVPQTGAAATTLNLSCLCGASFTVINIPTIPTLLLEITTRPNRLVDRNLQVKIARRSRVQKWQSMEGRTGVGGGTPRGGPGYVLERARAWVRLHRRASPRARGRAAAGSVKLG